MEEWDTCAQFRIKKQTSRSGVSELRPAKAFHPAAQTFCQ